MRHKLISQVSNALSNIQTKIDGQEMEVALGKRKRHDHGHSNTEVWNQTITRFQEFGEGNSEEYDEMNRSSKRLKQDQNNDNQQQKNLQTDDDLKTLRIPKSNPLQIQHQSNSDDLYDEHLSSHSIVCPTYIMSKLSNTVPSLGKGA